MKPQPSIPFLRSIAMWEANSAFFRIPALFAAEPTPVFDFKTLGPILPAVIGVVFALVVVAVGLLLCRKKPASAEEAAAAAQGQPPASVEPSPLWALGRLVFPCVALAGLVGVVVFIAMPIYQGMNAAKEGAKSHIQSSYEETMQSVMNPRDLGLPKGQAVEFKPIQLPPTPQIDTSKYKYQPPPPPRPPTFKGGFPDPRR